MSQQDLLRRFLFEDVGVRGLWVSLSSSWQTAKQHQHCPDAVQLQLGQALTAVVLLSATIKFNGFMILQVQGDGPLKTLVAQATHERKIRGLVRSSETVTNGPLQDMFGEGRLVLTVSSENAQPYQGIVPLQGDNLAAVLETYFAQSEQLNTRLWLFANETHAAGLLLQELPSQLNDRADWERIAMLASTVTEQEMLELGCEELLYRLFNEEKVRLFDAEPVAFDCSCSRLKIENTLRMLGRQELESVLQERGQIEVNCEFCNKYYRFDRIDVEQLLHWGKNISADTQIRH
ncbi:MAG: Hsp33 family molecular chaperone HslO [Methyloglobulus sp.]|nr:Hsp33 family molecular chaperone HslO [Methyloglobulus sp.]